MSENITLTTLLAYISFLLLCDTDFATLALGLLRWVQNSTYWTWNPLEKTGIEPYNEYCKEILSAVGTCKRGIHSSPRGSFLWGGDRWELGEIGGGDNHGRVRKRAISF